MTPVLEVDRFSFSFDTRAVLREIGFLVQPGEKVGLVGANGAGKSTLLWCLLGLLHGKGSVRLFGDVPGRKCLAGIGVVFQNPEDQLFMPTLLDDLTLPLLNRRVEPRTAQLRAIAALRQVGLEQYAAEPATHLSLGQRKRAAIALALAGEPELLILDEPTAELDGRSVRELSAFLSVLPLTLLIASHHLEFLRAITNRLIVLADGRILADGPAPSILADNSLLQGAGLL